MVRKLIPDVVQGQRLLTLPPTATVREAARRMAKRGVPSVLVNEDGRLVGIFTGTDLISRVVAPGLDPGTTALSAVMTANPATIGPDSRAIEALQRMQIGHYRHLPVVHNEKLVGILSRRDFLGYEIDEIERREKIGEKV